jgi:hypothetical protein
MCSAAVSAAGVCAGETSPLQPAGGQRYEKWHLRLSFASAIQCPEEASRE